VTIQFTLIGLIVWLPHTLNDNDILIAVRLVSITLGVWAIVSMKIRNLRVFPEPKIDAVFIARGPYKLIRHPMYTSVLLFTFSYTLKDLTITTAVLWITLLIDLLLKIRFEEELLEKKFPQYVDYKSKTKKLIFFIY
jgi:protein-S-isoprenylcysteine O-methyltransferase Ste14